MLISDGVWGLHLDTAFMILYANRIIRNILLHTYKNASTKDSLLLSLIGIIHCHIEISYSLHYDRGAYRRLPHIHKRYDHLTCLKLALLLSRVIMIKPHDIV